MKRISALAIALFYFVSIGFAQQLGVNRASIKWQQYNTPSSRIIFPVGQDSIAKRVATLTEALGERHRGTIGDKIRKVDIIIQAENTLSNAYVGLGPYRSELYMTPPQDPFVLGANNWADQLAIHEFRHAQQFSNFRVGLSKLGIILGGEYGQAIANNMAVPDWFWEGDAVWNETVHTQQGRGRLPYFFNGYKSLDYSGRKYPWLKLRNGSLKDFVPNHYDLGYLLVTYGREKYGDTLWYKVTQEAAAFKGLFYPIEKSVKKHTGISYRQFTNDALAYFSNQWMPKKGDAPAWKTGVQKNNVINYRYPYPTEEGKIIALKTSFRQIPVFVELDTNGTERRIEVKDIGYDDYFSYRNGTIVYTAFQPDKRWDNREYSVITMLDVATRTQRNITTRSRYFSPDIFKEKVVAVEVVPGRPAQLHIVNLFGDILQAFSADSSLFYSHPKWTEDGNHVVVAARTHVGDMGWLLWTPETGQHRWLMEPAPGVVGFPVVQGNLLVHTRTMEGRDALYALNMQTGDYFPLASYGTGIYQGFLAGNQVIGSVFTAEGFRLGSWQMPEAQPKTDGGTPDILPPLYVNSSFSEFEDLSALPTKDYEAEKYRKSFKLFNFHSWIPEPNEPDYTFTLVGENVLSTLNTEVFYNFNTNENFHELGARLIFGDSYVMPFVNATQRWGREVRLNKDTTLTYNESEFGGGLFLPINLTGGRYFRRLNLTSAINANNVRWTGLAKNLLEDRYVTSWQNRLTYVAQIQRAVQHIYPRFGQTLILDYRNTINNVSANQFLLNSAFYFPGFHVNHNLVFTAAYQARDTLREYFFPNSFPFSRGYNAINYPRMWRIGLNYHFPLFYPDWGFGGIVYFRRVRANAFFDHTIGRSLRTGINTPFNTAGAEIFFDSKWWNTEAVSFGFRYSYLLNTDLIEPGRAGLFEFVLPVNLFGR